MPKAEPNPPAMTKLVEALQGSAKPAISETDWINGEIECDALQLEKPYGYQLDDSLAVGSSVSNRHGVTGKVEQIVWIARRGYYRVRLRCAGNPSKGLALGDIRYIIIPSGVATTR